MTPINAKSKIILVAPEATYATDPAPTGLANAMLLTDVSLQPMEGEDVSRNLELPYLGAQEEIPAGLRVVLTGSFELVGSGTAGVAPAWSPLMRACGVAEIVTAGATVEYVPISEAHESVAVHFLIGYTRHIILGAKATGVITMNAQGIPVCRVTITGLYSRPAETTRPAVDLSKFQQPQIVTKKNVPVFTIAGATFVLRSYSLDLACDVQPRLLANDERILIVDRNELLSTTVEAVPLTTYDPFARAEDRTRQEVVIEHGTTAGKITRITVPTAQQRRVSGLEQNQNIAEWPLTFRPLPSGAGNNQWKLTIK